MKKKILFITTGITKDNNKVAISGGDIRLFEIMRHIYQQNEYDVHLLTNKNGKELTKKLKVPYTKLIAINYSVSSSFSSNFYITLLTIIKSRYMNSQYDIVYSSCEHIYNVLPALRVKLAQKSKWIAAYHWVEEYPWLDTRGNTPAFVRYSYWLNRVISGLLIKYFSDEILAVSKVTKNKLICTKHIPSRKIRVVYCGVDYAKINLIPVQKKNYDAVFIKRLNYGKGVLDLLSIWKEVCKKRHGATLVIIGDGNKEVIDKINKFITDNNLDSNIILLGAIYDFNLKFRIIKSAKLFVLPSHEENWAIVIGEAMAAQVPVLAYDLKEIVPIWRDNVEWIPFANTNIFASKILQYLNNEGRRHRLAEKAYNFVKKYDWNEIVKDEIK